MAATDPKTVMPETTEGLSKMIQQNHIYVMVESQLKNVCRQVDTGGVEDRGNLPGSDGFTSFPKRYPETAILNADSRTGGGES